MRQYKHEIIVGMAIIAAIVILVLGYVFIREIPLRNNGYHITILFNNVSGLTQGDAVKVSGVKVGRVKNIQLEKNDVAVNVWVEQKIPFPRDSRAFIKSIGMIGEKYIDLIPGQGDEYLESGDKIVGNYSSDLAEVGEPISELISQATTILAKINNSVDELYLKQAREDALVSLTNLKEITTRFEHNFDSNMKSMEKAIVNVDSLTTNLVAFWHKNDGALDHTLANFASSSEKLPVIMAKLDSSLTVTRILLARVENAEGTVGKALANDDLYLRAEKTIDDVQVLLADMKRRPGRYFSASLIDLF